MSFSQLKLNESIQKAITAVGYDKPTPIQAQAIPPILAGKDVVACAQTGSGKTAAFVLPALQRLADEGASKKPRILILTPTRELASQITKAANDYGRYLRFNIISLVGGMPYHNQIRDLERGADIIVATPGRLMDHMESRRVDLSGIELLVLDEADRMLDMGFIEDVEYIAKLTPKHRQTLLFSATIDKQIATVVKSLLKDPVRIDLSTEQVDIPKIKQEMYRVTNLQHKGKLLRHFLSGENIYKAIIFTATKMLADKLATQLREDGFAAAALHGDLRQNVRTRTLEQLRKGKIQFLVATDVAARGIDISDVTHVFNYDLPRFCEDYVHRIGRTGRAGKTGIAISFVGPADAKNLKSIERYTKQRIQLLNPTDILKHHEAHYTPKEAPFELPKHEGGGRGGRPHHGGGRDRGDRAPRFEREGGSFKKRSSEGNRFEKRGRSDSADGHRDRTERSGSRFERDSSSFKKRSSEGGRFEKRERSDRAEGNRDRGERSGSRFERDSSPFKKRSSEGGRFEKRERSARADGHRDRTERSGSRFERDSSPFKKRSSEGGRFEKRGHSDRAEGNRDRGERSGSRFERDSSPFKKRSSEGDRFEKRGHSDRVEGSRDRSDRFDRDAKPRFKKTDGARSFKPTGEKLDGSRPFMKKKTDGGKSRWKASDRQERKRKED